MDRFRGSRFGASSSKASASTVCQKCLKRGHYSYECKATVQDRPYASRPSRTQQLLNPKLAPKLNDENPNKLLDKAGIADEILAAKQAGSSRGRKRSLGDDDNDDDVAGTGGPTSRKRSRSLSSAYTSDSVSTISTDASRSSSRSPSRSPPRRARPREGGGERDGKRQRGASVASSGSYDSESDVERRDIGRLRKRTGSVDGRRRARDRSESRSLSEGPSARRSGHSRQAAKRRRSPSYSGDSDDARHTNATGRRGTEPGRNRGGRERPAGRSRSRSPYRDAGQNKDRSGSYNKSQENGARNVHDNIVPGPRARQERSLSPYSKRMALTRAMNG